ncbi:MAG: universal stress protein [Alphaproteobacteria bacterium]
MRKFLVVVDDSDEMFKALHYAALRAKHTGGTLVLLYIQEPPEYSHWLGVESMIQQEGAEQATARLQEVAMKAKKITGEMPEMIAREGDKPQAMLNLLKEDQTISIVVLGANHSSNNKTDGQGPILNHFLGRNGNALPVPITVIPGDLSFEQIDRIA